MLNHALGQYISFAFNEPKKYPKKPFYAEHKKQEPMTDNAMEEMAKNITLMMGGTVN